MDDAISMSDFLTKMSENSQLDVKIQASIQEVCQMAGCWIGVNINEEEEMRVKFKDHFTIPKNVAGRKCVFQGTASVDTVSVDELKHYAGDAGMSQAAIDSITEPEIEIGFGENAILVKQE